MYSKCDVHATQRPPQVDRWDGHAALSGNVDAGRMNAAQTKIFAMPSIDRQRQLTVYKNTVQTAEPALMVLPVPFPETIAFEKVPTSLFEQCTASFEIMAAPRSAWGPLEVISHGSYEVTIVQSLQDLSRIPELDAELVTSLQTTYSPIYGALMCRLTPGLVDYVPLAYSHRMDSDLFIPVSEKGWDHKIYTLGTRIHSAHNSLIRIPKQRNAIQWATMPAAFQASQHQMRILEYTEGERDLFLPVVQTSS
jgi:hypothetical protein